jgi:hypothetical protein
MTDTPDDTDKKAKGKPSLKDDQIETRRGMSRRAMLRGFGVGTLGLGGAAVSGCVPTTTASGVTDIDNGNITDPIGFGRGPRRGYRTGVTDADFGGNITDPVGYGRG